SVQGVMAGSGWLSQNLWLAWAMFAGSWIWILVISLLALALSAWVKWRIAAGALLLAVFFVAAGFGEAINAVLEVHWGRLINLMTGLLRPTQGRIHVLGVPPDQPERLFRFVGYCTQFDSFPRGMTGYQFVYSYLRLHGKTAEEAADLTADAIERVRLTDAAHRKIAGYSKGMRQRIKLAQAISH